MPGSRRTRCVLVSGGIDSAVLLHRLLRQGRGVAPLYIRCGFVWERAEMYWLSRLLRTLRAGRLRPLGILEVPLQALYGPHWGFTGRGVPGATSPDSAVYLPGRNLILLSQAAVWCVRRGLQTIALGTLAGNPFRDASPAFFRAFARCASRALGAPVRIEAPFRGWSKARVIRAEEAAFWGLTFSCLRPRGRRHCGACNKCLERARAFRAAGVPDPTRYASALPW